MRIVIIGAGGHAQVVADILRCMGDAGKQLQIAGYLDDACSLHGKEILDARVLGPISELPRIPHDAVIVAIGDNRIRSRYFEEIKNAGERLFVARHPQSVISSDVEIQQGSMICAGVVVNTGSVIGENVILNTGSTVDHHNRIGEHAHLAPGVHTGGKVSVGRGVLIGLGASIMPNCTIGSWSIIGAGAVVHRSLQECVTAVGVPARIIDTVGRQVKR